MVASLGCLVLGNARVSAAVGRTLKLRAHSPACVFGGSWPLPLAQASYNPRVLALRLEVAHKERSNTKIKPAAKVSWISICRQADQLQQPVAAVGATKLHRAAFAVGIEAFELLRLVGVWDGARPQ